MIRFDAEYTMTIAGRGAAAGPVFDIVNPATGAPFARAPDCTPAELDEAVTSATEAFQSWKTLPIVDRQERLRAAGAAIARHAEGLSRLFTREQGRPIDGAKQEIDGAAAWLEAVSHMAPPVHVSEDSAAQLVETRYAPLGVVCAIAPWNFPISLAVWKLAPALLAGNTVVLKPSPYTPLATLKMGEILRDVLPAGVLNVISGGDALGPMMTAHPGFAKISFTGSTATGKLVMASAAKDLKRLTLELGGNDAAIVMDDVDPDEIAEKIFFNAFYNTAQICVATKRLYVHAAVYEGLKSRLHAIARTIKIGDGSEQGASLGPVQNERQYRRVLELLDDARAQNLVLLQGGDVPEGAGYFIPLTIIDNPPENARVVQEEAFGPVLPMLRFDDVDEVVARVNASDYGLGASVWSKDVEAAMRVARRLEAGTVWINQNINLRPDTPFAGHKKSGFGVENGVEGLLEFMVPQAMYVARS